MASNSRLPDVTVLLELKDGGMDNKLIGQKYGVTSEAVRLALKRAGYQSEKLRTNHQHYLPWRIRADHTHDVIARRLRAYSKRQQGGTLPEDEARKLAAWEDFMNGGNPHGIPLSVHYDRRDAEGFWLSPREPGDRDYIHPPK